MRNDNASHLSRADVLAALELTDRLLDVTDPDDVAAVVLPGLAGLVGGDSAVWREVDLRTVRELTVSWGVDRSTAERAEAVAATLHSHPLIELSTAWHRSAARPPGLGRLSDYVTPDEWRRTPIRNEAMRDVDDQLIMMHSVHGPVLRLVSIERGGAAYGDEQVQLLGLVARHVRAALHRAVPSPRTVATGSAALKVDRGQSPGPAVTPLTPRQHQVLRLVADGLTDQQIASRLGTSRRTVSKHLQRAYAALGVSNRVSALQVLDSAVR